MEEDITLWFGNTGTRLDKYGNVYSVSRGEGTDEPFTPPDMVSIYQSILRECGFTVNVEDTESPYDKWKRRIIHTISNKGGHLPYVHKSFGYEYEATHYEFREAMKG